MFNYLYGLFSNDLSIDLGTASGRLIANVLASVAAYETEIRGERVKAGQETFVSYNTETILSEQTKGNTDAPTVIADQQTQREATQRKTTYSQSELAGKIERVIYRNTVTGYSVVLLDEGDTLVGTFPELLSGQN